MKAEAVILALLLSVSLGFPQRKPKGLWAAKDLTGIPTPRIIGGEIVQGREFPGQVSVQVGGGHNCGGSIINENYILTAGHCSKHDMTLVTILSGTNNIRSGGTRHQVTEIKIHQFYDPLHSWHNDIAVMKVEPPFTFDDSTSPVKLPAFGQTTAVNSSATVIGWGVTKEGGSVSPDLRKADILIFDHEECDKIYSEDYQRIYPEQICAYTPEGGVGSCNGDSGGPLFVNGEVIGLVSWARGCDRVGYPTVYTEVADYIDWIEEKIQS